MKAIRWHGRKDVRLDEIAEPAISSVDEVLLRVLFCGICGTDVEEFMRGPICVPVGLPHPLTGRVAPLTLGHEFCGIVELVGDAVDGFQPGDLVAVEGNIY
ncbi:MAG: alcohol dehydrogenase catalytic domain-containing protein, partial [Candidatus Saccharimonadales bacterium]